MESRLSFLLTVGFSFILLTGCATTPDQYANYQKVVVVATEDQKFVVGNTKVSVSEFADKAAYDRKSPEVVFVVSKDSKVLESTMRELVKIFQSRGYNVHMSPDSKYADLIDKVKKP